ncbi:MAG TPA: helix-turn-helix transcriptional regulator [Chloroflexota bacterium]|nr:helix-turn-helix transcriptional regulator [Chloroflexota bacterium]
MTTTTRWSAPGYQRIGSAQYDGGKLLVRFEDGNRVSVDATRALPPGSPEVDWGSMTVGPYEILVPAPDGQIEIPWSTIRVLTDRGYAAHLAAAAEQQARQIGRQIKKLRESRNLTGKELAERAGISPQSLSRIEHGKHDVVFSTLRRILAAMGYSLTDLVEGAGVAGGPAAEVHPTAARRPRRTSTR